MQVPVATPLELEIKFLASLFSISFPRYNQVSQKKTVIWSLPKCYRILLHQQTAICLCCTEARQEQRRMLPNALFERQEEGGSGLECPPWTNMIGSVFYSIALDSACAKIFSLGHSRIS